MGFKHLLLCHATRNYLRLSRFDLAIALNIASIRNIRTTDKLKSRAMAVLLVYCSYSCRQARSHPVFSGKPEGPSLCLSFTFIFRDERNWMKKSARVSEKLVSPGLPGLQVATRLVAVTYRQLIYK